MKYKLIPYSIMEYGQRKDSQGNPHQEDCMFPEYGNATDKDRLFILCDGMGGHDAGEVASATVCESMSKSILDAKPNSEGDFSEEILQKAIVDAYKALDKKDTGADKKMGTTMTLLKLYDGGGMIAWMGDSRVYQIRPGKDGEKAQIVFKTKDHSLVNDLIAVGEMTEEEAKHSNQKNVITRAFQPNIEYRSKADVYQTTDIQTGDYFYMCSDGMLENMDDQQLCFYFSQKGWTDENIAEKLKLATAQNHDNHTAFIIHILEVIDPIAKKEPEKIKTLDIPSVLMVEAEDGEDAPKPEDVTEEPTPSPIIIDNDPMHPSSFNAGNTKKKGLNWVVILTILVVIAIAVIVFMPNKEKTSTQVESPEQIEETSNHKPSGKSHRTGPQKQNVQSTPQQETEPVDEGIEENVEMSDQSQAIPATSLPIPSIGSNTNQSTNTSSVLESATNTINGDTEDIPVSNESTENSKGD